MAEAVKEKNTGSSIEVTKNAKKEYAFKVKFYFDPEVTGSDAVIAEMEAAYKLLETKFK